MYMACSFQWVTPQQQIGHTLTMEWSTFIPSVLQCCGGSCESDNESWVWLNSCVLLWLNADVEGSFLVTLAI